MLRSVSRMGLGIVLCAGVAGALWAYPQVGGFTELANFDHRPISTKALDPVDGIVFTATWAEIYNRRSKNMAGAAYLFSARNPTKEPRCFRITFRATADAHSEGSGKTWLIGKKQTLRNIGSVNSINNYRCDYGTSCTVGYEDVKVMTWAPVSKGVCGATPGGDWAA